MSKLTAKELEQLQAPFELDDYNINLQQVDENEYWWRVSLSLRRQSIIDRLNCVFGVGGWLLDEQEQADGVRVTISIPDRGLAWSAVGDKIPGDTMVRAAATIALQRAAHLLEVGSYLNKTYPDPPYIRTSDKIRDLFKGFKEGHYPDFDEWHTPGRATADIFTHDSIVEYKNGKLVDTLRQIGSVVHDAKPSELNESDILAPLNKYVIQQGGSVFTELGHVPADTAKAFFRHCMDVYPGEVKEAFELLSPKASIGKLLENFGIAADKPLEAHNSVVDVVRLRKFCEQVFEAANQEALIIATNEVVVSNGDVTIDYHGMQVTIIDHRMLLTRDSTGIIDQAIDAQERGRKPECTVSIYDTEFEVGLREDVGLYVVTATAIE